MRPVIPDDTRQSKKPWWVLGNSRKYALFLAFFYLVFGCFWIVLGVVQDRWWDIAIGVSWLVLDVAAWATAWWHHHQPPPPRSSPAADGARRE